MERQEPECGGVARVASESGGWPGMVRRLRPGLLFLLAAPALLWLAEGLYLPILAPALGPWARWLVALGIVLLAGLSLVAHAVAHTVAACRLGAALPERLPLGPLGDSAQAWPPSPRPRQEALITLAGPLSSAAIAALAGLLWRAQLAPGLDAVALFMAAFNGTLAALNLAPAYPFDGGRLVRLTLVGAIGRPERVSAAAGWALVGALLAWAGYVAATRSRFSGETSLALIAVGALIALALAARPARHEPAAALRAGPVRSLQRGMAALLSAVLLAPALALVPTPYGLYAPGGAVPVAPMVEVSALEPEPTEGALLLTTIIGQTPILAGQWLAGQLDPAVTIVPPERVVPLETSPQALMAENARLLAESEVVAIVVGLRLAGYEAQVTGSGVRVLEVLPESLAQGLLRPGDRIVALGGVVVRTASDMLVALGGRDAEAPVEAVVMRGEQTLHLQLPLLPPSAPDSSPRLGATIATAELAVDAPVPVQIQPRSIIGGPSAGLMFTLAIYDRLTPGDLTGGQQIAGTGTMSRDGRVGPIGGVAQKVAAAERAGATYFLVPRENAADARRVAQRIMIIEVGHVADALTALRRISASHTREAAIR